ncbi:ABC transporter permease [Millionella massiliensis]|uniref:ABC transporter permease n=1 Tax=Millionella massiliensis TaxID=1871023 RepID=UPI0008D90656|nr:ABC transporter permease [Millionella massiliensis]
MIKYLLTILWNDRRRFTGIILEQMLVFIVLLICVVSLNDMYQRYREPGLLDTDNVVEFGYMIPNRQTYTPVRHEINQALNASLERMLQWDYVEGISESSSLIPYLREMYYRDSVIIAGKTYEAQSKTADQEAQLVFGIEMECGEWLPATSDETQPAVISRQLAELTGLTDQELIGTTVRMRNSNRTYRITGITAGIKSEDVFAKPEPCIIRPIGPYEEQNNKTYRELCARVKPGHVQEFCSASYRELKRQLPYFDRMEVFNNSMDNLKTKIMFPVTSRLKMLAIPTIFLLIFAFIGTLGLLMLHVKKRTPEFGLHRAIGASKRQQMQMMILQSLLLTLVASVPGLILSLFIFAVTLDHILATAVALAIMLLFSLISSYYPARKIASINPAEVLRQE